MSSYFSNHLLPGERIVGQTKLHWLIFCPPIWAMFLFALAVFLLYWLCIPTLLPLPDEAVTQVQEVKNRTDEIAGDLLDRLGTSFRPASGATIPLVVGVFLGLVVLLWFWGRWLTYAAADFAVTNKRVLVKQGLLRRTSVELILNKIESIGVDQGLMGRIFDYGTLVVKGTGGTVEEFPCIAAPMIFRRRIQEQIAANP